MNRTARGTRTANIVGYALGALAVASAIVLGRAGIKISGWIIAAACLVPITVLIGWQLWRSRAALALLLRGMAGGSKPVWLNRDAAGNLYGKCPQCGAAVVFSEIEAGQALRCDKCGATAAWRRPAQAG
jgi:hypothetical protein